MSYSKSYSDQFSIGHSFLVNSSSLGKTYNRSYSGSRSGEKMDNYKDKIRAGENASTPYTLNRTKIEKITKGKTIELLRYKTPVSPPTFRSEVYEGTLQEPPYSLTHLSVNAGEADSVALSKLYKKLDSETSRLNSPAVLAEFLDVVRQFGKPAEALVDLTNRHLNRLELEKRRLTAVKFNPIRWTEILASTYLEWSFGVKPLISDTKAVAEALAQWQFESSEEILQKLRAKVVSRGLVTNETVRYGATRPSQGSSRYTTTKHKKTEGRIQYVVGLQGDLRADFDSNQRLLQLLGFDHGNWIPAVWEVVPWSWLVDYFFNINNILDAAVTSTARVAWICKTKVTRTSESYRTTLDPVYNYNSSLCDRVSRTNYNAGGSYDVVRTTLSRTVPATLGLPPLYFRHPFKDAGKLANMVAVLFARRPSASALHIT